PPPPQGFYPQQPGPQYGPFPQDAAQASYPPQIYPPQQQIDPAAYAAQQAFAGQDPNAYQAQQIQQQPIQQPQGYDPNVYTAQMQGQSAQPAQAPLQQQPQGYDPAQYQAQAQPAAATQPATAYNQNAFGQQQYQQPTQPTQAPSANANVPVTGTQQPAYDPNSYNAQYAGQPAGQSAAAGVPSSTEQQPATQPQEPTQQQQGQPAQGIQPAAGDTPKVFTGTPPYPFDPTAQYPDANAQAWAQYYAAGGDDPQGAVYFISVPGVKEAAPATSPPAGNADPSQYGVATQQTQQQQQQHHATDAYSTQQLSPKSPTGQLKASPKSNRLSMAGVGTVAQHPHLQSSLPTYAHEQAQGKRPSSAGSGSAAASSWPHQQHQATAVGATSPGGAGPWNPQNPHIVEPARTDSTSPPGGYRPYYG
ncbi:ESCRT-0 subunit protein hse1, partial [Serendipita sp. 399]